METENTYPNNDTYLAQWLSGALSDEALKEFVSDSDFKAYKKIRKGLEIHEALEGSIDTSFSKIKNRIDHRKATVKSINTKAWVYGVAASIVLFLGLFTILGNDGTTIETGIGEQRTLALMDGSEVILNAKSTVRYDTDDWKNNRTITLEGEAYFKVAKGSQFTVKTQNGDVKVLGTQFNVNARNDLLEVVCYEGMVRVLTNDGAHDLVPSNMLRRINGDPIETYLEERQTPSWVQGESSFKSMPLRYVISALEAQYGISIIAGTIDSGLIYTGSFMHNNLDTALKTVFKPLDIHYIEKEKGQIYLSKK